MKVPEMALGTTRRCFRCGTELRITADNTAPVASAATSEKGAGEASGNASGPAKESAPEAAYAHGKDGGRVRIGELLVMEGVISRAQLQAGLERQRVSGGKLVENLIALQYLDTKTFLKFLSRQPGTASIDVLNYTIPPDVIQLVPAEFALHHDLLPIDNMGNHLTVGMACPLDSRTINELVEMTGMKIRPLLVSIGDIRVAINRYYGPRERATFSMSAGPEGSLSRLRAPGRPGAASPAAPARGTVVEAVASDDHSVSSSEGVAYLARMLTALPALPETILLIRRAMESPTTTASGVAALIGRDPALAAKIISLANNPALDFKQSVPGVELATALLGLREVYSVALSSPVARPAGAGRGFDYAAFCKRAHICATAAGIIARESGKEDGAGIAAAALLHDLGRAAFAEVAPESYGELDQRQPDAALIAQESERFGIAHPELGYILGREWHLPVMITESMRYHHEVHRAREAPGVVTIVALAALLADSYGRISSDNVRAFAGQCREALQSLKMSEQQFVEVLAETSRTIKEVEYLETVKA